MPTQTDQHVGSDGAIVNPADTTPARVEGQPSSGLRGTPQGQDGDGKATDPTPPSSPSKRARSLVRAELHVLRLRRLVSDLAQEKADLLDALREIAETQEGTAEMRAIARRAIESTEDSK